MSSSPATTGEREARGHLTRGWKYCPGSGRIAPLGRLPTRDETTAAMNLLTRPAWRLDPLAHTAERLSDCPLSLNGIAKGFIVERPCDAAFQPSSGVRAVLLNVGGDLRVRGPASHTIGIVALRQFRIIGSLASDRSERPLGRHQREITARVSDQQSVALSCF